MSGFVAAVLVAVAVQLFQSAEDWWLIGRKIFGVLLVFAVITVTLLGAEHYSASEGNLRAILLGR